MQEPERPSHASARAGATRVLTSVMQGDPKAADQLMGLVYEELRLLAAAQLKREQVGHTLQPTALVHEAYLRMIDADGMEWNGRTHFFATAATMIRRILVDHARAKHSKKRGGGAECLEWEGFEAPADPKHKSMIEVLALDEALGKLERFSKRMAEIVELHFFGGLLFEDIAKHLQISDRTVRNEWRAARAWLLEEMK